MKGSLHTDELLGAVVRREAGLRTGRRLSHVFFMDVPTYHKPLMVTDAAINIAPTLAEKADICQNAIDLAHALGVAQPKVAILSGGGEHQREDSLDDRRRRRCARWPTAARSPAALLDGPLAMDNAISREAAAIKGIASAVAGRRRHPARARPRFRQHPRQAAHLHGQRRRRRHRARREGPDRAHQPRRQRARAAHLLRARHPGGERERRRRRHAVSGPWTTASSPSTRAPPRSSSRCSRGATADVPQAGARRPDRRPGRAPAPQGKGRERPRGRCRPAAREGCRASRRARLPGRLAACATPRAGASSPSATAWCTAPRAIRSPCASTMPVLEALKSFIPLAPLHQPHNLAGIEAMRDSTGRRAAGGLLRHRLPPQPAAARAAVRAAAAPHRRGRAPLRLSRPVLRVHRRNPAAAPGRQGRRQGHRRAPRQRRLAVRHGAAPQPRLARWASPPWTG